MQINNEMNLNSYLLSLMLSKSESINEKIAKITRFLINNMGQINLTEVYNLIKDIQLAGTIDMQHLCEFLPEQINIYVPLIVYLIDLESNIKNESLKYTPHDDHSYE